MLLTLIVCNVLYGWFNDIWSEVFYLLILGFLSFCTSRWAWYLSKHLRSFNALTIAVAYFLVGLSLVSYSMTIPDHLMDLSLFGTSSEVTVIFLVVLMMSVITHLSYVGLVLDQLALVQLRAIKAEQSAKQADMLGNQISHMDRRGRIAVMSSSLAHELNQPLTAATTYAQLAERVYRLQHTASRVLPVIDQVELAIDRTVRILQRIRGGDIAAQHFKKVDLQKVLDQALDLMSPDFDRWPVTLTHDRSLLPVWCMGDELELSQVVVNLLRNSLQAMDRQSMRSLWVSCSVEQGQAKLVIRDQGPGIPTDMMGKWGEPFQTMREGGMGLGLAISLEIMTRHHGKLQLTNLPQGGVEAVMLLLHLNEVAK